MALTRRSFGKSAATGLLGLLPAGLRGGVRPYPRLLVWFIAGQFRTDYLDRTGRSLTAGGFRRLMEEGAVFPDGRAAASTFTAASLATLATGCWPQLHGIVADIWYDRAGREVVAAGPEGLLATTLAEQAAPRTRVFVCGNDERHTGLLAGQTPAQNYVMNGRGQFTTRGEPPAWLTEYNRLHPVENVHNAKWMALGAGSGVPPLRTLAYDSAHPERFFALYRSSPFAQAAQFEFMRELAVRERLGQGDTLDLLMVPLGALALLGYEVGADSPLVDQLVLHLDREIEFTLDGLNKTPGLGAYAVVFTGAHGAPALPPAARRTRMAVSGEALARSIDRALSERFDTPPGRNVWVEKYVYPFLYLRAEPLRARNARDVRAAAARAATANPAVAGWLTADGDCSHGGEWERRFRNSFHRERSGDVMLSYQPGFVEEYGAGRGVSYGSLYNYDAQVPLFFYGPQFRPGVFEGRAEIIDVAPTLARVMGIPPPSSSTGRVLGEALAEPKPRK